MRLAGPSGSRPARCPSVAAHLRSRALRRCSAAHDLCRAASALAWSSQSFQLCRSPDATRSDPGAGVGPQYLAMGPLSAVASEGSPSIASVSKALSIAFKLKNLIPALIVLIARMDSSPAVLPMTRTQWIQVSASSGCFQWGTEPCLVTCGPFTILAARLAGTVLRASARRVVG